MPSREAGPFGAEILGRHAGARKIRTARLYRTLTTPAAHRTRWHRPRFGKRRLPEASLIDRWVRIDAPKGFRVHAWSVIHRCLTDCPCYHPSGWLLANAEGRPLLDVLTKPPDHWNVARQRTPHRTLSVAEQAPLAELREEGLACRCPNNKTTCWRCLAPQRQGKSRRSPPNSRRSRPGCLPLSQR